MGFWYCVDGLNMMAVHIFDGRVFNSIVFNGLMAIHILDRRLLDGMVFSDMVAAHLFISMVRMIRRGLYIILVLVAEIGVDSIIALALAGGETLLMPLEMPVCPRGSIAGRPRGRVEKRCRAAATHLRAVRPVSGAREVIQAHPGMVKLQTGDAVGETHGVVWQEGVTAAAVLSLRWPRRRGWRRGCRPGSRRGAGGWCRTSLSLSWLDFSQCMNGYRWVMDGASTDHAAVRLGLVLERQGESGYVH